MVDALVFFLKYLFNYLEIEDNILHICFRIVLEEIKQNIFFRFK